MARIEAINRETKVIISKPVGELKAKKFLSVREVAKLIGCSRQTVYTLINAGRLKAVNLKVKKTIVKRTEVDRLFA